MTARTLIALTALTILVSWTPFVEAGGTEGKVSATDVARRSKDMLEKIEWQSDMTKAFEEAKKQNKPVLWVQMVGDLDGGL